MCKIPPVGLGMALNEKRRIHNGWGSFEPFCNIILGDFLQQKTKKKTIQKPTSFVTTLSDKPQLEKIPPPLSSQLYIIIGVEIHDAGNWTEQIAIYLILTATQHILPVTSFSVPL